MRAADRMWKNLFGSRKGAVIPSQSKSGHFKHKFSWDHTLFYLYTKDK